MCGNINVTDHRLRLHLSAFCCARTARRNSLPAYFRSFLDPPRVESLGMLVAQQLVSLGVGLSLIEGCYG